ncbi:MAG: tRNA (adenosine(37)-N6)-threonylcarbamoyltransferase complex dimerization subunit type 1 TsaB [Pirellulales bacterium]
MPDTFGRVPKSDRIAPLYITASAMTAELRILALETTGLSGTVAALVGDRVLTTLDLAAGRRSAQSLVPGIAELCRDVGWQIADVQLVAVTAGPGSFTGLRVGVTTAKTLAYATGAVVLAVDTLAVIAAQAPPPIVDVWATFDAQRGELFVARSERRDPNDPLAWETTAQARIVDAATWFAGLAPAAAVTGPPLARWQDSLPAETTIVAEEFRHPHAATVGRLAWRMHQAGVRHDLWTLTPNYLRASAAEEKLIANKTQAGGKS